MTRVDTALLWRFINFKCNYIDLEEDLLSDQKTNLLHGTKMSDCNFILITGYCSL